MLYDDERLDEVNDAIKLIQKPGGLTFGTDALLLAGYINSRNARALELGSGSGIISMLLVTREKAASVTALEVQKDYAELTMRNANINSLSEKITTVNIDLRDFKVNSEFDLVFTNPPYMTKDSGKSNAFEGKNVARHEVMGDITDFCICAKRCLKFGGTFAVVYRPDRLTDLISAMRQEALEPKRVTFVYADTDSESSIVLIEAKRGGKSGLMLTPPLIIYKDKKHSEYTDDMNYIMENGSFPEKFKRK